MLLTVVELIFALLVSFFLVVYLSLKPGSEASEIENIKKENSDLKKKLDASNRQFEESKKETETLQAKLDSLNKEHNSPDFISKQRPSCIEKKIARSFLAEVTILGSNRFAVGEQEFDFDGLRAKFDADIKRGKSEGCTQSVLVSAGKHLALEQYDAGLRKIEGVFYHQRAKVR